MNFLGRLLNGLRKPRTLIVLALLGVLAASLLMSVTSTADEPTLPELTYRGEWSLLDLQRHIESGEVVAITRAVDPAGNSHPAAKGDDEAVFLAAKLTNGQVMKIKLVTSQADAVMALNSMGYGNLITEEAVEAVIEATASEGGDAATLDLVFRIIMFAGMGVFVFWFLRKSGMLGGGGKKYELKGGSKAEEEGDAEAKLSLDDIAGHEEAKFELVEAVEFLKNPAKFARLGAKSPRGVLLYGPPGNGKSMFGRAIANEAGVPFLYASGSEFVEKYVGVGASRVRDLFATARKAGQCVLFIDEIDALARARGGSGANGNHAESDQTLNQLLTEMDGFNTTDGVVVIAATNRIDTLDPAVTRPGRFTRKIAIPQPEVTAREAILRVHAKNKPLGPDVDLAEVAEHTYGFSGAMLADLLNEAAISAVRRGSDLIEAIDIENGWEKTAVGTSRSRSMAVRERSIIAAHEVGHALCGHLHGVRSKIKVISLMQHGDALGYTASSQGDDFLPSEHDLRGRLVALMGGRAAEELLFATYTGGAANDFEKATELATRMVNVWGMGRDPLDTTLGPTGRGVLSTLTGNDESSLSPALKEARSRAIRAILDEAYATAKTTLHANLDLLSAISGYLFKREKLTGEDFADLVAGHIVVSSEDALNWRDADSKPRDWDEVRRNAPLPSVQSPVMPTSPAASSPTPAPAVRRSPRRKRGLLPVLRRRVRQWLAEEEEAV